MAQSRYPMARRGTTSPAWFENWNDWINRFMTPSFFERSLATGNIAPVDVCERDNEFVIHMACAGCRPEDVDVTVDDDMVRIRGKFMDHEMMSGQGGSGSQQGSQPGTQTGTPGGAQGSAMQTTGAQSGMMGGQREACLIRELPTGRFERDIMLPTPVNAQGAKANFENGMLTMMLPKAQATQGQKIQITRGGQQGTGMGTGTPTGSGSR